MSRPRHNWLSDIILLTLLLAAFVLLAPIPSVSAEPSRDLQLEVLINGQKTNLIAAFKQVPGNGPGKGLFTARSELEELFVRPPATPQPADLVRLEDLGGVSYKIDEPTQTLHLMVADQQRLRRTYDAHNVVDKPAAARADYGAVINYSLYSAATQDVKNWAQPTFSGANAGFDTRLITPHGVLNNGFLIGANVAGETQTLRLDSYALRVNPETLETTRVGDGISGGLSWTRPFRFGGVQLQTNYRFRSDLVTASLPSFSGSAAVPSTVDVYVNNVKTFTQSVGEGPFEINNLPLTSGSGEARVVVRDASGKEQVSTLPFNATGQLLKDGVYESSLEIGLPRLRYGIVSDDYEAQLVAAATLRRGMTENVTLEAHTEAGLGIVNGGLGVVTRLPKVGIATFAISASDRTSDRTSDSANNRVGVQGYAAIETRIGPVTARASTLRSTRYYDDIARVSATLRPSLFSVPTGSFLGGRYELKPSRAVDTVSFGIPLGFDPSSINATFLRVEADDGETSRIGIVSYSRPLIAGANFFATAFYDFDHTKSRGIFAGVHVPLGGTPLGRGASATAGVAHTPQGTTYTGDVGRSLGSNAGDWGWRIRDAEGAQSYREAAIGHRTEIATIEAGVRQDQDKASGRVLVEGAVVAMGGRAYLTNRVDDGFAVVDTGAPGVTVKHQNNVVGRTGSDGRILVPGLQSYQNNRISIDPSNLPVDAEVDKTSIQATPAFRSGVAVDFQVRTSVAAAIVILHGADGKPLKPGTEVRLNGADAPKTLGYDGQAYLNDLKPANAVTVTDERGQVCNAQFKYVPQPGTQSVVGPVVCQ